MKEMTDRKLTDKIRQVFDDFGDPTAEFGWRELRKKYPENDKKLLPLWWVTVAAVLMVVCGLWFIIPDTNEGAKEVSKANSMEQINKVSNNKHSENTSKNRYNPDSVSSRSLPLSANTGEAKTSTYPNLPVSITLQPRLSRKRLIATSTVPLKLESSDVLSSVAIQRVPFESDSQKTPQISLPEALNTKSALNWSEIARDSVIDFTGKMLALAQQNPEVDIHQHQVKETVYQSKKTSSKNHAFSFFAGSYFNYSLGSETKLNFGAGFTSDIKLSSNLKLSTGLALANNSLTYNNGVPSSSKQKLTFDALPSFGSGITNGSVNNNLTTITKYDASLLTLDIPINLKYFIIPKDNKLYLLAGLSSGTYLAETYSLDYRNYSLTGLNVVQNQGIEIKRQLQAFDIGRILNISFGYSANLGKSQNITIEPFLKYPLSGLGSEDLKFGATGINLKLNFSKFKK